MNSGDWKDLRRKILAASMAVVVLLGWARGPVLAADQERVSSAVEEISSRWVAAVAEESPELIALVSVNADPYYSNLRDLALHGPMVAIEALHPVDQLQVMFLRLTVPSHRLAKMSGEEILLHAIREGWIGKDLRRTDELREVQIKGDTASGRLFKFGLDDRPDRSRQYFSYQDGFWKVELRGERERLERDFDSFTRRSGLSDSEAAFFILETRLMRKIVPADFVAPVSASASLEGEILAVPRDLLPIESRVLVTVREAPGHPQLAAATIADVDRSLRYVVRVGELLGDGTGYRLERLDGDQVWLIRDGDRVALSLDSDGLSLHQLRAKGGGAGAESSLLDHANLGKDRLGMMSQWRNTGLRGRPQLLQQGSLIPRIVPGEDEIAGLRAGQILPGSFWDQMGLSEGDVIQEVNGAEIDSMMRWREFMDIAETAQEISLLLERGGRPIRFLIRTVPTRARGSDA